MTHQPLFVLVGGVPGAGKSTLLRNHAHAPPGPAAPDDPAAAPAVAPGTPPVHLIDPDRLRAHLPAIARHTRAGYRISRTVVHTLTALWVLAVLLRGPGRARRTVLVHDPATRPRRRRLTGWLAARRGWRPVLLFIDVPRELALAGQHERGRVVHSRNFEGHWRRSRQEVDRLRRQGLTGDSAEPWWLTYVVDRGTAGPMLDLLLEVSAGRPVRSHTPGRRPVPVAEAG